jgi:hypothetical protein
MSVPVAAAVTQLLGASPFWNPNDARTRIMTFAEAHTAGRARKTVRQELRLYLAVGAKPLRLTIRPEGSVEIRAA